MERFCKHECLDRGREASANLRLAKQILGGLAAACLASLPVISHAQAYPTRPVSIVVAFTAGGTTDIKQMISQGADPAGGTPAEFGQFVQREYEKWKLVVRESGATAE